MERNQGQRPGGKRESSAEILGRYSLLAEIAEGELTTVHLAKQHGDSGFQRLVALRRLKPLFALKPECVQLLLDEARLTSALHHANVVGCLDMGTEGGCYVVQNYVEGDSLDNLLTRAGSERHPRYTVPLLVDILNGLHAVHTALDDDGVPLGLVHQAPRARHVLVGIDGIARLTDFTQAKARIIAPTRQRSDRLKVADMAPEQALHPEAVDHRADLFLVGVTLWEALTGERLFAAEGDENTFQHLLHRRIPRPSEVGLRPPRCFDGVCLRALERDPDKRYRSSLDMARELRDVALNHALYATTGEIGQWVKALAGPKLIERRKLSGSESSSQELPIETLPSSSSGFFQSMKTADPYGSGLIFGGSFSRLDQALLIDTDKTPAIGTRASVAPLRDSEASNAIASAYDDEPTARHNTVRERQSTEPMWPVTASRPTPKEPAPKQVAAKTLNEVRGVLGKTPSTRSDAGKSPGAYSQIAVDRKTRPSSPSASFFAAKTVESGSLGRAPSKPITATVTGRPSLPPSNPAAARVSRPHVRTRAAVDAPSPVDQRRDSTPTGLRVPTGPVGSPYRDAAPSKAPSTFETPSLPRALSELTGRTQHADVLRMPVDSLTPSNVAQQTLPPAMEDEPSPRSSRAIWLVTGLLATIILLAAGVSVRNWQNAKDELHRASMAQPKAPVVVEPVKPKLHPEPLPVPEEMAAEPGLDPIQDEQASEAAAQATQPSAATQAPLAKPELASPSTSSNPEGATSAEKPVRSVKRRGRNPLPIPDNPY